MKEKFSMALETSKGIMVTVTELPEHPEAGCGIMITGINWENGTREAKTSIHFSEEAGLLLKDLLNTWKPNI